MVLHGRKIMFSMGWKLRNNKSLGENTYTSQPFNFCPAISQFSVIFAFLTLFQLGRDNFYHCDSLEPYSYQALGGISPYMSIT